MPFAFRLEGYQRYIEKVGDATYLDVTRRTDPTRIQKVWSNLLAVVTAFGAPWIVQIWTKDPTGVLNRGEGLLRRLLDKGTTITAQITVTGLGGTEWEPRAPSKPFHGVSALAEIIGGPGHVTWRYDPIIPTMHSLDRFRCLAEKAAGLGISRGVISFMSQPGRYKRVDSRLADLMPSWSKVRSWYDHAWKMQTAQEIVTVANEMGIQVACCAESALLLGDIKNLLPAACGDYHWFAILSGRDPGRVPFAGSRLDCGCALYFDVGMYGQWKRCHGCLYCYAG